MIKLEQVLVKRNNLEQNADQEAEYSLVLVLKELREENLEQEKQKRSKRSWKKLLEKAKYNAKYLEELSSVDQARNKGVYRNYGVL